MTETRDSIQVVKDDAQEAATVAAAALQKLLGEASLHSVEQKLAVLTERVTGNERARNLDISEVQRRLLELNHAHEKQVKDQATYIERRVFETTMQDFAKWRDAINSTIAGLDSRLVSREAFDVHVKDKDIWRESVNGQLSSLAGRDLGHGSSRELFFKVLAAIMGLVSLYLLFLRLSP